MDIQKIGEFLKELRRKNNMTQDSINEILMGEKLKEEDYKEAAENNITYTLEEIEAKEKKFKNIVLIIMGITSIQKNLQINIFPGIL